MAKASRQRQKIENPWAFDGIRTTQHMTLDGDFIPDHKIIDSFKTELLDKAVTQQQYHRPPLVQDDLAFNERLTARLQALGLYHTHL